ncbi:hypothetical protein [Streptomyces sp. cmx-4-9]|uniref:hypothetical protein n=1 Tax=Streptomyces sp. cmx-4-9 TaxID=2790941 RepID=UPI003981426D
MSVPTKTAAHLKQGDVIGYEGQWRKVRALKAATDTLGEPLVVVAWEEGGIDSFSAADELLLEAPPKPTWTQR